MADFTAVIRRAVEGLPEQSPELRARVYEKARSAVIRQMENMSPPPPEALVKRQIDKIDAAIAEVESEFAEALPPADDAPGEEPVSEDRYEDLPEDVPAEEPGHEPEDEPVGAPDDAPPAWQTAEDEAREGQEPVEFVDEPATSNASYPEEQSYDADDDRRTAQEDLYEHVPAQTDAPEEHVVDVAAETQDAGQADEPQPSGRRGMLHGATFELVHTPDRVDYEDREEDEEAYSYDVTDEPVETDAGTVIVEPDEDPEAWEDDARPEPVDDWDFEATTAKAATFDPAPPPPRRSVPEKDWAHVDSLLGLEPEEPGDGFDDFDEMAGGPAEHRGDDEAETGGRRKVVLIAGAVIVALILVVGGYFSWVNRERIIAAISPADQQQTAETTPAETPETPAPEPQETETAENAKPYTQRLLPDGTEVDEGLPAASAASGPARSVANQTSSSTPAETASATQTAEPAPPVGAAQKMYLYEEQLGQSVPSAYQGTVEWELKQENTGTAVSEPVVEGVMNVPDAGLTGVLTFRRNDDPSLPASHLIDIAFTLDESFEGGGIDNVQRISMKGTEAARGDPLIAVSAKITDDLYMLALNDFDQARAQNLALLGDRNWIDIPVTYRNGRRALLTLEKGTTGMAIFDRAIQEWQALGDINSGN
ncbi:hypothetical protein FF124_06085 [Martelella lutilitoris]|uniref:Uncharacterized protein n=1 Tax=Martelella lutilitoris TaxID=2583532 RepID=A0A5C4JTC9_9HYPH|nr:hypothetical protein [Martelella lutilitoris]TNB48695.1 hypothetical protein FF124_06085 [Martelella lutilitoris]